MFLSYILLYFVAISTAVRYDNYTYYRAVPSHDSHLDFLRILNNIGFDVNFWTEPGVLGKPVEFTIAPSNKSLFLENAKKLTMSVTLLHDNIQSLFDEEAKKFEFRSDKNFNWDYFFGLDDIYAWLKDLEKKRAPEIELHTIGKTVQSRDIIAARINLMGSIRRSKVVIEGGIHAREWISPAFVTYLISQILYASNSNDEKLKKIALTYDWYFIPILNPDGYDYSYKQDRMWRKNRNGQGVDLNRNFANKFGVASGQHPNEETYCGANAFSEKETFAWSNYVKYIGHDVEYYLAFHSYGQFMIMPYAHTKNHMDNYDEVYELASNAAAVIKSKHNIAYKVGNAYETVGYTGGGMSMCWVKHTFKVPYVITLELRDQGFYGFALPTHLIMPTCTETLAGLISLLQPKENSFAAVKEKYRKTVEKYYVSIKDGSGRVFFLKTVIVFNVICNILL